MNTAQTFNENGARIECETLYSPFIRLLGIGKLSAPAKARSIPVEPKKKWPEVILAALKSGPCSAGELFTRCRTERANKATFHTYLSEMALDGRIERYGHKQPYAYGPKLK